MEKLQQLLNSIPTDLLMEQLDQCEFPKDQNWDEGSTTWYLDNVEIKIQATDVSIKDNIKYDGLKGELHYQITCKFNDGEISKQERDDLYNEIESMNDSLMDNDWLWEATNPLICEEIDETLEKLRASQDKSEEK